MLNTTLQTNESIITRKDGYLKIIGNFQGQVPQQFGKEEVYDLRTRKGTISRWGYIDYPGLKTFFVLLDPLDDDIYGDYVSDSQSLKWSQTIRLQKDIIMAGYYPGINTSRTGMHGTQHFQYLATRHHVSKTVLELTAPVRSGWYGQELPSHKDTSSYIPYGHYGKILRFGDFEYIHIRAHREFIQGTHAQNGKLGGLGRSYFKDIPEFMSLKIGGEILPITSPDIDELIMTLRNHGKLTHELHIFLLKEKLVQNKTHNTIQDFVSVLIHEAFLEQIPQRQVTEQKQIEKTMLEKGEILRDFGGHFRTMGMANQANYWVIKPNGESREPDEIVYRKKYSEEGEKRWFIVNPEEIALSWGKTIIWADHQFAVNKTTSFPSEEQIKTINRIQNEINQDWVDKSIGKPNPSPLVGKGWGFIIPNQSREVEGKGEPALESALLALKNRFKK